MFERTYTDKFNAKTASHAKRAVSGVVEGLQTALQQMRIGDRWQIFVPYQLGYNGRSATGTVLSSSQTTVSIQPYSTLFTRLHWSSFFAYVRKFLMQMHSGDGNSSSLLFLSLSLNVGY